MEFEKDCLHLSLSIYSFETIHTINPIEVELAPNMRYTMKNWNMTVQWWLAAYVHRKVPFKAIRLVTITKLQYCKLKMFATTLYHQL